MLNASEVAGRRANYQKRLAQEWIRAHRPDIWEKIRDESYVQFPNPGLQKRRTMTKTVLPQGFAGKQWK